MCTHSCPPMAVGTHTQRRNATSAHTSFTYTRFHTANTHYPCRKPQPTCTYMSVPTHVHTHAHTVNTPCTHIRAHTLHPETQSCEHTVAQKWSNPSHTCVHIHAHGHMSVPTHLPTHANTPFTDTQGNLPTRSEGTTDMRTDPLHTRPHTLLTHHRT